MYGRLRGCFIWQFQAEICTWRSINVFVCMRIRNGEKYDKLGRMYGKVPWNELCTCRKGVGNCRKIYQQYALRVWDGTMSEPGHACALTGYGIRTTCGSRKSWEATGARNKIAVNLKAGAVDRDWSCTVDGQEPALAKVRGRVGQRSLLGGGSPR